MIFLRQVHNYILPVSISAALFFWSFGVCGAQTPRRPDGVGVAFPSVVVMAAVSPDGTGAAQVDVNGWVRLYDGSANLKLEDRWAGCTFITVSNRPNRIFAAGLTGKKWWVKYTTQKGHLIWKQKLQGNVLSIAISPDGDTAFAATTGQKLYIFDFTKSPKWRRVTSSHTYSYLEYNQVADGLLVQTSELPGFGIAETNGKIRWWKRKPAGQFYMTSGAQGARILTAVGSISGEPTVGFTLYNTVGTALVSRSVEGYEPRAALSSSGGHIAFSFRRKLVHKNKAVMERRVALYTESGKKLWEQGGLFFKPVLAGFTENPLGVLIAEDYTLLSCLDKYGKLAWRGPLMGGRLKTLIQGGEWKLAWALFDDGTAQLWQIGK